MWCGCLNSNCTWSLKHEMEAERVSDWKHNHTTEPSDAPRVISLTGHRNRQTAGSHELRNRCPSSWGILRNLMVTLMLVDVHRCRTPYAISPYVILHHTWSFWSIFTCVLWNNDPMTTYLWAWFVFILVLWTHNMHFFNLIATHFVTVEVAKMIGSRMVQNDDHVLVSRQYFVWSRSGVYWSRSGV